MAGYSDLLLSVTHMRHFQRILLKGIPGLGPQKMAVDIADIKFSSHALDPAPMSIPLLSVACVLCSDLRWVWVALRAGFTSNMT